MKHTVAALLALLLWTPSAGGQDPTFDSVVALVREHFYDADGLEAFEAELPRQQAALAAGPGARDGAIAVLLASLGVSHTARYTPDGVDYHELVDVFRAALRRDIRRLFPPEGRVSYEGIGIATAEMDGRLFATRVLDGGPADRAGLLPGDEILAADGAPFAEIASFEGRAGQAVRLSVRRRGGAAPFEIAVPVEVLNPSEMLGAAIDASVEILEEGGRRLGHVRLWSLHRPETRGFLAELLGTGRLADVDGLVVDLRGRWGGGSPDGAELFVGGTPDFRLVGRDGRVRPTNIRWDRPVVAIVDEGTRSGLELYAYALQRNDIPLVGTRTAGALLAGTAFLLPDDSLLILAVSDVLVEGRRLEGVGVAPDIEIPFDVRYAAGRDPQRDAAVAELLRLVGAP